jgi:dihydroceramide fatty acyl 2-hydroxylase
MFGLAPHPHLTRPQRGSPRMFKVDWIEKYFSRVKPSHVIAIWVPALAWCLWHQARLPGTSPERLLASVAAGVLAWTLMEYVLHRFLFHFKPDEKSEWQKDASFLIHGIHHDYPWDADRLVMPPTAAIVIGAVLWIPVHFIFGAYAFSAFAGLIGGYVWYDLTHYYLHHAKPTTALGKWLRKYHMVHHFATPNVRYGITTPLWDHVFGTYPRDSYATAASESADTLEARQ